MLAVRYEDVVAASQHPEPKLLFLFEACGITHEDGQAALAAATNASHTDQHAGSIFSARRLAAVNPLKFTPRMLKQARDICERFGVPWAAFQARDPVIDREDGARDARLPKTLLLLDLVRG
jgi:hypothetical protein